MENLEIEYKTLLTENEYEQLIKKFSLEKATPFFQRNFYFDTKDFFLKKNNYALRIRQFKKGGEQTLKIPQKKGKLEVTDPLSATELVSLLEKKTLKPNSSVEQALKKCQLSLNDLLFLGDLTTYRLELNTPLGILALDKSYYQGKVDYELELEVQNTKTTKEDFLQFLNDSHVIYKKAHSKTKRATENSI